MSKLAERCRRGHEIAVQICNEKGGIKSLGNAKVFYEYADCGDRPEGAISECERLITQGNISVITGCYASSLTLPAAEVAERHRIPFVVSDATANELTERGFRYTFRAGATNAVYCDTAVKFGFEVLQAKTLGVVYADLLIGKMLVTDVKKRAEQLGIEVVLDAPYDPDSTDLSGPVTKIKLSDPDFVVAASYVDDAVLLAHTMKRKDCNVHAFVGMGAGHAIPEFLKNAGEDAEYFASVACWCHDMKTPGSRELALRYIQKYGEYPIEHPGSCFQASTVLFDALERAVSTDPERISEALRKTDMMTICGRVKTDLSGQNSLTKCVIVQVLNGQFATIWPTEVASKRPIFPVPQWRQRGSR
jgi:branched-chain amino acid transport system substrate-binding protein